ncbi:uncharacterized protein LOC105629933 [Jatropha curcas]|uniref:uncharacterized protein LOC105629933 n=1 Tax=Jatropha curcas TaxID=180498 RepID=UPI001893ECC4|nr:uncharacterized protein LOC105629933 [Jatropha curcas]
MARGCLRPHLGNQIKQNFIQYVATLREQLEQLAEERTLDGLPRVSKAKVNDYSEKVEAIASKLAAPLHHIQVSEEPFAESSMSENPKSDGETWFPSSPGLRRRFVAAPNLDDRAHGVTQVDTSATVKQDAAAKQRIEKHMYFYTV